MNVIQIARGIANQRGAGVLATYDAILTPNELYAPHNVEHNANMDAIGFQSLITLNNNPNSFL